MPLIPDARDLLLTDGDLTISSGDLVLCSEGDAIKQAIGQALTLFLGEWFLDESAGTPYYERILGKGADLNAIRSIFRDKIESVPGVSEVLSLNLGFDRHTRGLSVTWRVSSDFGELTATQEVGV